MKIATQIAKLEAALPKRSLAGQLYRLKKETQASFRKVTLYTLFYSSQGTHMLRPHVFETGGESRTPLEWNEWFNELVNATNGRSDEPMTIKRLSYIQVKHVLPGLAKRTQKDWAVQKIIGWVGHAVHKPKRPAKRRGRNQTKHKRKQNG